jgi:hypothetical protein
MVDPIRDLKEYGRDLAAIPVSRLPASFEKAAFLCVNTYASYRLNIGVTPINDAVIFAKRLKKFGYARSFLKYLDRFSGRWPGSSCCSTWGTGTGRAGGGDSPDQAFVFDDGPSTRRT